MKKPKKIKRGKPAARAGKQGHSKELERLQADLAELVRAATLRDLKRIAAVAENNDAAIDMAMALSFLIAAIRDKTQEAAKAKEELQSSSRGGPPDKDQLAAIKQMTSVIAHEVRNPLAVINNSTYFIKTKLSAGPPLDEKVAKHLGFIESEIQKANGIIDDILAFTRRPTVNRSKTDLNAFLRELLDAYPVKDGYSFERNFSPGELPALLDSEQLGSAVCKILDNAVDAMPSGGKIVVTTSRANDRRPMITVTDLGAGIAKDIVGRIFEPFFTTKPRGVGLGLAVAEAIVQAHDGELSVESWVGKGSTFVIVISETAGDPPSLGLG